MPHQDCPGIIQVDMNYQIGTEKITNVFHVDHLGGDHWTAAEINTALDDFEQSYWTTLQKPLVPASLVLTSIVATDLTDLDGLKIVRTIDPAQPGTKAGDGLPANATLAIKMAGFSRGRGVAGRIFWPQLPESEVVSNLIAQTYVDDAVDCVRGLLDVLAAETPALALCTLSRVTGGAPRPFGIARAILTIQAVDNIVDSQRTRLPGHKRKRKHIVAP